MIRIYIIILISITQAQEYDDLQREEISSVHYFEIKVLEHAIIYVKCN